METSWTAIPGYPGYEASPLGGVRNAKTKREIKTAAKAKKYHMVTLSGKQIAAHRLVALTFIPNPDNLAFVNHKDGNKRNNCIDNLEWITHKDNVRHAVAMGRGGRDYMKNGVRVTHPDGRQEFYDSTSKAEEAMGLCQGTVNRCNRKCNGYLYTNNTQTTWRYRLEYFNETPVDVEERPVTVEGYEHLNARSNGTLVNREHKRAVTGSYDGKYRRVKAMGGGKTSMALHIIIAKTFIDNPDNKPFVNHKDGNTTNNAVSNLEWCTQSENMKHAHDTGLISEEAKKTMIDKVSVPVYQLELDGSIIARHDNIKKAAEAVGTNAQTITAVCKHYLARENPHYSAGFGWCYIEDFKGPIVNEVVKERFPELLSDLSKLNFSELREKLCFKTARLADTAVSQLNDDGTVRADYVTADLAAETLGLNKYSILSVCKGKNKKCGGYAWRFKTA